MEQELVSPQLIGKPNAWKSIIKLQLEKFEGHCEQMRIENMELHAKMQAENTKLHIETRLNADNSSKRLENIRRRLERKKEIERKRKKKTLHAKQKVEVKFAQEHAADKRREAFLGKNKIIREVREEKYRKQQAHQLKVALAREKQEQLQQKLQNLRLAEEKKQEALRKHWGSTEQRAGQFQDQQRERRKIGKMAHELLSKANFDETLRKETLDGRWKKAANLGAICGGAQILHLWPSVRCHLPTCCCSCLWRWSFTWPPWPPR